MAPVLSLEKNVCSYLACIPSEAVTIPRIHSAKVMLWKAWNQHGPPSPDESAGGVDQDKSEDVDHDDDFDSPEDEDYHEYCNHGESVESDNLYDEWQSSELVASFDLRVTSRCHGNVCLLEYRARRG
uniref:Uncharacterized protein n=1 Tax=Timema cristinae TaxID=61476 RepID=A0A7R9D982_TIMCR|nr:unnamed protein product [Timema cristinae]